MKQHVLNVSWQGLYLSYVALLRESQRDLKLESLCALRNWLWKSIEIIKMIQEWKGLVVHRILRFSGRTVLNPQKFVESLLERQNHFLWIENIFADCPAWLNTFSLKASTILNSLMSKRVAGRQSCTLNYWSWLLLDDNPNLCFRSHLQNNAMHFQRVYQIWASDLPLEILWNRCFRVWTVLLRVESAAVPSHH